MPSELFAQFWFSVWSRVISSRSVWSCWQSESIEARSSDGRSGKLAEASRRRSISWRSSGPGYGPLTIRMHSLGTGRRDNHRNGNRLIRHRCRQILFRGQAGDVRREAQFAEGGPVVGERQTLLRAGDKARRTPIRQSFSSPTAGPRRRFRTKGCSSGGSYSGAGITGEYVGHGAWIAGRARNVTIRPSRPSS